MRTDLTTALSTALSADARKPRQLAVFHFSTAGDVYVSDQAMGVADGLSNEYSALVEDWGEITDMAGGDPTDHAAGEIRQITITLWNGGSSPFSNYFLADDPENVTVDVYQWAVGLSESDLALIDTFVVQDPIAFDEAGRLLSLDLVSLFMRYDAYIGDVLNADDWPLALESDLGQGIDVVVGNPGTVKCLCAKTAPIATLDGSILADTLEVAVKEDLDDLEWDNSGVAIISDEKMRYSSRTASVLTIVQRGYLSEAVEHLDGDQVLQEIDDYVFLVSGSSISAINEVKVAGSPAPAGIYSTFPELNPARIIFSEPPYSVQFASGSTFLALQFDATNSDNTAYQAYNAYDSADDATAAKINQTYSKLSLRQVTENTDRGQIIKCYLVVEHWESSAFVSDYAEVSISGIGVIGRLSRPNISDTTTVEAEVDIDHTHTHQIGGDHTHTFTDPSLVTADSSHSHGSSGISTTTTYYPDQAMGIIQYVYKSNAPFIYRSFPGSPTSWSNATLTITCSLHAAGLQLYLPSKGLTGYYTLSNGTNNIGLGPRSSSSSFTVALRATHENIYGSAYIGALSIEITVNSVITSSYTGVTTSIQTSGSNSSASDKSADDVNPLATDNATVEITDVESSTRSLANIFDITAYVDFDWDWFTDRDVSIEYKGSNEGKDVFILHCFFDIEYRKKEIVYSTDVTCEPVGLVDDASGTMTGTPGALIRRPDHLRQWALCNRGGLPDSIIDSTSFSAAGARYDTLGYAFDGVLDADATVRETEKRMSRQCRSRFFWNAGLAKIAFRESTTDWSISRELVAADLRLKGIRAERRNASEIVNAIRLWYAKDWSSASAGSGAYKKSVADSDAASIALHGAREQRDGFLFDLVSDDDMADDLLAYYLDYLATVSTFYTIPVYLPQFDLEKEDVVAVTSAFGKLRKARMVIRSGDRVFGSGKLGRINLIRLVAECIHYSLVEHTADDAVTAADALTIELGLSANLADLVHIAEAITAAIDAVNSESATVSDVLAVVANFSSALDETVNATDALAAGLTVALSDSVEISDFSQAWRNHGFGGGEFGSGGFGGYTVWRADAQEQAEASDELAMVMSAEITDEATISENVLFGSGFGGSFTYFGQSPFGG